MSAVGWWNCLPANNDGETRAEARPVVSGGDRLIRHSTTTVERHGTLVKELSAGTIEGSDRLVPAGATGSYPGRSLLAGVIARLFRSAGLLAGIVNHVPRVAMAFAFTQQNAPRDFRTRPVLGARFIQNICHVLVELSRDSPIVIGADDAQHAAVPLFAVPLFGPRSPGTQRRRPGVRTM